MSLKFKIAKIKKKLGVKNAVIDYYKKQGLVIGKNCNICCALPIKEIYLLDIGDNVVISYGVNFITHDASYGAIVNQKYIDLYGKIKIGNNCFVGAGSTIIYGVSLGDKTIVAAGSVVTKSFEEGNVVIGGNPAKVICSIDEFLEKNKTLLIDTKGLDFNSKREKILSSQNLIKK